MKTRTTLITASMTVLLAASGSALAAGVGGGSASDNNDATGGGAAANGVYQAPTQGVEQGVPATGNTGTTQTHHRTRMRHHAAKPANDTTNIPGADASSDTKGQ